eukprot:763565-Hanusia_phi.AAC.1
MASIRSREGVNLSWQENVADQMREANRQSEGSNAVGVGISLERQSSWLDCYPQIARVFPGGSAHIDGRIRQGDWLIKVDGRDIKYLPLNNIKQAILGGTGTLVQLEIESDGAKFLVELMRRPNNAKGESGQNVSHLHDSIPLFTNLNP